MDSFFDQTFYVILVKYIGDAPAKTLSLLYVFTVVMKIIFGTVEAVVNTTSVEWDNKCWHRIKKSTAYSFFTVILDVVLRIKLPQAPKK